MTLYGSKATKSKDMISNDFEESYGAQIQKDHIETRRMHLVRSKSDQIWTRTQEITGFEIGVRG